ncbi:hypothetical protein DFH27DRAFT_624355 [Peziza echinospora]|nr:hypothetical protein DFH27DRAFT_624355 [Peziza echinospora]
MYLISAGKTDKVIRPNSALLLTTSFMSMTFIISWMLAIGNNLSRAPPPSGKKAAFTFLLISTTFWFASVWTGVDVAVHKLVCREGADYLEGPAPWSDGLSCRMHRVGVAFSAFGLIASLVILGSMIEISDRAFGGISTQAKLHWTTEKFREALIEISEMSDDTERGDCGSSLDSRSIQTAFGSTTTTTASSTPAPPPQTPSPSLSTQRSFEFEAVGRAAMADNGGGNGGGGGGGGGEKRQLSEGGVVVVEMEKRLSRKIRPKK